MITQFPFTSAGVQDWQNEVYAMGQTGIDDECSLIQNDFVDWIITRFSLTPSQRDYVNALSTWTHQSYSSSIQGVLQQRGTIELHKEDTPTAVSDSGTPQNSKITTMEERLEEWFGNNRASSHSNNKSEREISLLFKIVYSEQK